MLYLVFSFTVALLGMLALFEWRRAHAPKGKRLAKHLRQATQLMLVEEWEGAAILLEALQEKAPGDLTVLLATIQLYQSTGRREEARELIERTLEIYPNCLTAMKEKGKLALEEGKADEALALFERCHPLMREEEDRLRLATAHFLVGEAEEALDTLEDLLEGSQNGPLLALAADCLFAKGEKKAALCLYERAERARLYNVSITARKGHCLKHLGRYTEAGRCFTEILQRDNSNVSATLSLGACYEAKGEHETALLVYQHGRAWEEQDLRVVKAAGMAALYAERFEEATELLRSACLKGDLSSKTLVFLGYSFECQQRWEEAEATYLQVTADYPHHPAGYRGLAWLFGVGRSRTLDLTAGLEMARRSLDLMPDAASWEVLSACEARAGNFAEAHQIQENLSVGEEDHNELVRRKQAMRALRRNLPLDEHLVARSLVA